MPPKQTGVVAPAVPPEIGTPDDTMGIKIPGKPAVSAPIGPSGQTMQISVPQGKTTEEDATPSTTMRIDIPPQQPQKRDRSSTVMLKPLSPAQSTKPGVAVGIPQAGTKKDTSKIPLEAASSTEKGPQKPKTIRIKPASAKGTADAPAKNAKRETSRISLDAALGDDSNAPAAPKTIKLKRPSEAPTVRSKPTAMTQTACLDDTAIDESQSATQKKTIKVKRPTARKSIQPGVSTRHPVVSGISSQAAPEPIVDTAHWTFIVSAAASIIISFVLIYVLCAQTFGPNVDQTSLTPLSYGANDMNLSWPGKVIYQ